MSRRALAALALLAACVRVPAPAPPAPALSSREPGAVMAEVSARDAAVRTLRARFSSIARTADGLRTVDGVVLVARPDRLRFRLFLPFGLTVFDYLRVGREAWLALPLGGSDAAFAYASQMLPRTFARYGSARGYDGCRAGTVGADTLSVLCEITDGEVVRPDRIVRIRLGDGAVEAEQFIVDDAVASVARYDDYRMVAGAYLPFHIVIDDVRPERPHSVDVSIEHYDVNPTLADTLFEPPAGSTPIAVP